MKSRSHEQAMIPAEEEPSTLKRSKRARRLIERLIDMLEANDRKKDKAPDYVKALDKLGLMKVFARVNHGNPKPPVLQEFKILYRTLKLGNITVAEDKEAFELIDFNGNIFDGLKLEKDGKALEDKMRCNVRSDNRRVHPMLMYKIPKWIEKLLECW